MQQKPNPIESILFKEQVQSCREATARLNIWEGSVSSGKTYCSIWKWLSWIRFDAPTNGAFLMVGKTERTLQRNIIDPIQEMIGERRFHLNKASGVISYYGRTIYVVGANDERSENKIRGMTLAGAYGDEITLWPESFFKMLLSRLRVRGARLYGTTNPDSPYHWLKTDFLDREAELNLKRFIFRLGINVTLDPEYTKSLMAEYTGLWYRRFIDGEWCQAEGAIYDMFDEARHVVAVLPPDNADPVMKQCVSVDYGTSNPTVFEHMLKLASGKICVSSEYYYDGRESMRQKTDEEYLTDMEAFYRANNLEKNKVPTIVDPSAASFKTALQQKHFAVFDACNDVIDGIRKVSSLLSQDKFVIHERCKKLRLEMSSYVWDRNAQLRGEDIPKKENDHAADAIRYGAMHLIGSRSGGAAGRIY